MLRVHEMMPLGIKPGGSVRRSGIGLRPLIRLVPGMGTPFGRLASIRDPVVGKATALRSWRGPSVELHVGDGGDAPMGGTAA